MPWFESWFSHPSSRRDARIILGIVAVVVVTLSLIALWQWATGAPVFR